MFYQPVIQRIGQSQDAGCATGVRVSVNRHQNLVQWEFQFFRTIKKIVPILQENVQNQKESSCVEKSQFGCVFCTAAVTRRYFPLFELASTIPTSKSLLLHNLSWVMWADSLTGVGMALIPVWSGVLASFPGAQTNADILILE